MEEENILTLIRSNLDYRLVPVEKQCHVNINGLIEDFKQYLDLKIKEAQINSTCGHDQKKEEKQQWTPNVYNLDIMKLRATPSNAEFRRLLHYWIKSELDQNKKL